MLFCLALHCIAGISAEQPKSLIFPVAKSYTHPCTCTLSSLPPALAASAH